MALVAIRNREERLMALNKLKGRIVEKYGTISGFVDESKISRYKITQIVNGSQSAKIDLAIKIAQLLEIPLDEIPLFFTNEVAKRNAEE